MSRMETLFVLGGTLVSDLISSRVFGFDSGRKAWVRYPDLLKARSCHRAVFAEKENALVVVGGSETWPSTGFGECEILQLPADNQDQSPPSWKRLPPLEHARSCHGLTYFESKVFACAGMMDPNRKRRSVGIDQFDLTNSCEVLSLSGKKESDPAAWERFPPLNLARFGLQLLSVELASRSFLLAIGGRGPNPLAEYSVEAIELDAAGNNKDTAWTVLNVKLKAPRIDFAATVVGRHSKRIDIVILGGNRVTQEEETDSSRTWEVLRIQLSADHGNLEATSVPGFTRLPSSRVGCRAATLHNLVSKKTILAVAGGFTAWGEGQMTYGGPLEQSVALLVIERDAEDSSGGTRVGTWLEPKSEKGLMELQNLPTKLRQPAVCVAAVAEPSATPGPAAGTITPEKNDAVMSDADATAAAATLAATITTADNKRKEVSTPSPATLTAEQAEEDDKVAKLTTFPSSSSSRSSSHGISARNSAEKKSTDEL